MTQSFPGNFIWYDYLASDAEAAIAFYGHLVGWKAQPIQQGYTMFVGSQGPQAGTIGMPEEVRKKGAPPHWSSNVHVADASHSALVPDADRPARPANVHFVPTLGGAAAVGTF